LLTSLGFTSEVVKTDLHPIIFAQRGGERVVAARAHLRALRRAAGGSVESLDDDALRADDSRQSHFRPRGGRQQGPLMTIIAAVASLLEEQPNLPLRLTFLIEGEEEMGSPSFPRFLESHKEPAQDGGFRFSLRHRAAESRPGRHHVRPARTRVARRSCHRREGRPALRTSRWRVAQSDPALAEIIATLHTPEGRVNVPVFYDDVLDVEPWEREELKKLGADEKAYKEFLGIDTFYTTPGFTPFEALRFQPTLEFNGIGGGYQGEGRRPSFRARPSRRSVAGSCPINAPTK